MPVSAAPVPAVTILAIDPATVRCGVAIVRVLLTGEIELCNAWCLHASGTGVEVRIQSLARQLLALRCHWDQTDSECLLAYEQPYSQTGENAQGYAGVEWVWAVIGAALALVDAPPVAVSTSAVAAQYRATGVRREEKKLMAVEWARQRFGLVLSARDHDAADAVAVGCAAGKIWRERTWAAQAQARQPALTGPRGGKL